MDSRSWRPRSRPHRPSRPPGQPAPQIAIQFQVHLLTPATLLVTVAAECAPWSGGNAFIIVAVEQPIAGTTYATEGVGTATVPCDGNTYDVVVDVGGGPFFVGDARKVLIVSP